tara:strand:- start:26203 stop:26676 length:474 start_codon:yes stop_codon:yes gene_type:complete
MPLIYNLVIEEATPMPHAEHAERAAIAQLMARYTINGDRGDVKSLAACFAHDGVLEFPGARAEGPDDIIEALTGNPRDPALSLVRHHLTSSLVQLEGPSSATGRTYFQVFSNTGLDHAGVYVDRFVRLPGGWYFSHRQVRIDWQSPDSLFRKFETRH